MFIKTLYAFALALLLAATAHGDIYKYRDESGKLILSNKPPPDGAKIESQHKSAPPAAHGQLGPADGQLSSDSQSSLTAPRSGLGPPPPPSRKLVDVRPLELGETRVEPTTAWWKKHVMGSIKNRSGMTTVHGVVVKTECFADGRLVDTGTAELGDIAPRGHRDFVIPITIPGYQGHWPHHGHGPYIFTPPSVSCNSRYSWTGTSY